ncbi:13690_t:CDS:2 [Racocetra fulgida]|uniref:13690_t:CDS:1 n=1 Tax=Racocetra fulgida TaxID=60492 RepID=A0A9N8ZUU9_9GLOM|nr:13690_t:CDS:2 [Racocetra fulgida]
MSATRTQKICPDKRKLGIATLRTVFSITVDKLGSTLMMLFYFLTVEAEMARTQKNKATSYHLGTLKAKLAKLRKELIAPSSGSGGGGGGFPSVGKSTLMSKLTGTFSAVAAYEFTTLTTVPGVLQYKGAKIQILDLPGRGRQVIAVARTCSLIFLVLDVLKPLTHKKIIETELEGFGIRLNKKPPNIYFKKKDKGGINMTNTVPLTHLDLDQVKAVLSEYKIHNADVNFKCDATVDDLIDVIEGRIYIPAIYVLNKVFQLMYLIYKIPHAVPISAHHVTFLSHRMTFFKLILAIQSTI